MDGRSKNGGARPGAGRKRKDDENDLITMLDACIKPEEWKEMFSVMFARACSGDILAGKLLMAYRYGMPVQRQELSGPDGSEVPIGYRMMTAPTPAPDE
jgi:hypothetical protein